MRSSFSMLPDAPEFRVLNKSTIMSPVPGHKGCFGNERGVRSETGSIFLRTMDDDLHAGEEQAAAAEARAQRAAADGNWKNGRPARGYTMRKGWQQ